MKIHVQTQIRENYGAHDWDGTGTCPQYWKMKGGCDYMIPLNGFRTDADFSEKNLRMIVDSIRTQIESDNEYFQEYILGWDIVKDDFLTEFERSQLEYDGAIKYPSKILASTLTKILDQIA